LKEIEEKNATAVSSYTHAVFFGRDPVLIGERINPTGKKRLKEALLSGELDYILSEATSQAELGAHILDVNVGLPNTDERAMLTKAVTEIQTVVNLPLQIDTADPVAMESALRRYNGKPLINSVCGKNESMEKIFPIAKKYGGVIIALTLDEEGIPETAEGRVKIAEKIIATAEKYGIKKSELIFDPLALTVSTGSDAAGVTLEALTRIKDELSAHTSLGVSNVSYGLPARDAVNAAFFTMALSKGLSAAIINPYSAEMMRAYYAYRALSGLDTGCADYIKAIPTLAVTSASLSNQPKITSREDFSSELTKAIAKGLREKAKFLTAELLKSAPALDIIEKEIIPALNAVGEGYENKTVYLPELLMSAEAAGASFEIIRATMPTGTNSTSSVKVVIATVEGDIHDIGKNIVKLILENYGYGVIDLGKDTPPERIADAVIESGAEVVGLSALMTTTLPAMERTVTLLRELTPNVKIMVGGAVLTKDYAEKIGADKYARDAMDAVRYLEEEYTVKV
jgi:5-methyltetrahydrofolate--homocysteine methyltransferase